MKIKKKLKIPIQFKIEYLSNSACQFQLASKTDGKTNILTFAIAWTLPPLSLASHLVPLYLHVRGGTNHTGKLYKMYTLNWEELSCNYIAGSNLAKSASMGTED